MSLDAQRAKDLEIRNPQGFLVRATYCRAIDEYRGRRRTRVCVSSLDLLKCGTEPDLAAQPPDH